MKIGIIGKGFVEVQYNSGFHQILAVMRLLKFMIKTQKEVSIH